MQTDRALEESLAREIGLAPDSLGRDAVARAVARVEKRAALSGESLVERLRARGGEWEMLVEELTIQESWFFRDRRSFECLAGFAVERASAGAPVRVLSAPCATGEEPYSIAMCLLETGLSPEQFVIDAVDISRRAIEAARAAVYTPNSFRKECGNRQARYFTPKGNVFELSRTIADCVRFARENIMDPQFASRRPYDVIFCRNLLIYLNDPARARLLASLDALLAPGGILFTGSSELSLLLARGYARLDGERSFGCRRAAAPEPRRFVPPAAAPRRPPAPAAAPSAPVALADTLADARRRADSGDLAAALAICDRLLAASPACADVYCLLGEIHRSAGKETLAEQHFHRALYLDPDHYETLVHMSMLAEKRRDDDAGRRFRRRAERARTARAGGES